MPPEHECQPAETALVIKEKDVPVGGGQSRREIHDWLVCVTNDSAEELSVGQLEKPRIQKVSKLLLRTVSTPNQKVFYPEVVSLGPYHHGSPHLAPMEKHKKAAAARFVKGSRHPIEDFYDKVREVACGARGCYADGFQLSDEAFTEMMFFDGCFVLHFIDCFERDDTKSLTVSPHLRGFITRDIFLLENQLPYAVLEALTTLKDVKLEGFIDKVMGTSSPSGLALRGGEEAVSKGSVGGGRVRPAHLLDLLRTKLLGDDVHAPAQKLQRPQGSVQANWQSFRSVMELKELGVELRKSKSCCLRDVRFGSGLVRAWLSLPPLVVDDSTRSRLLNLIALEMCPDGASDYGITSFVCFLDYLIDHAEDVKELRAVGVLLNALGSDQQVADLFNELAVDLSPDPDAYYHVVGDIDRHYHNRVRVSIVRMLHTHFSSPWTTISFIAAVFLLTLTVVQTVFAVYKK